MTKYISIKYCLLIILFGLFSCSSAPDFSNVPELTFLRMSKNTMDQNSLNTDSIVITFAFTDGDGDIGQELNDTTRNIILIDKRTDNIYTSFKSPAIPAEGASKGVSGEIDIRIFTTCCTFPDNIPACEAPPQFPTNMLNLELYMLDRAGNQSNIISIDPITLNCN